MNRQHVDVIFLMTWYEPYNFVLQVEAEAVRVINAFYYERFDPRWTRLQQITGKMRIIFATKSRKHVMLIDEEDCVIMYKRTQSLFKRGGKLK